MNLDDNQRTKRVSPAQTPQRNIEVLQGPLHGPNHQGYLEVNILAVALSLSLQPLQDLCSQQFPLFDIDLRLVIIANHLTSSPETI